MTKNSVAYTFQLNLAVRVGGFPVAPSLGYGMLAAKHNNIVDADGTVHCAVKDKDGSSVCDVDVRDKFADRPVSVHNADIISGRIERPAKQSLLLVHLKQCMTFRAERNDL